MEYDPEPIAGYWYQYPEKAQKFKVLDVDSATGEIEIQYFDGSVDQIDFYVWGAMNADQIEEPEDWTGPMDKIERDDLNYSSAEMPRQDWAGSYNENLQKDKASPRKNT